MRNARKAVRIDARVLHAIVNEFINIMKATQSAIVNLNNQFLKLEQHNSSQFDLTSLNARKNLISYDYNRICRDLSDIRKKLEHLGFSTTNNKQLNQIKEYNGTSEVIEILPGFENLFKDSDTSEMYKDTFKNLHKVELSAILLSAT